jgi:hypothetical protein
LALREDERVRGRVRKACSEPVQHLSRRATTHSDLMLRARELGIGVRSIHNASIMNAVGCCGLQLYSFGETVSMVFFTDSWKPDRYGGPWPLNCSVS